MINIDLIVGARPNFMKIAPIIHSIHVANIPEKKIRFRLIHTGQHYDANMSDTFFQQLDIPHPDFNLNVGGGTQAEQTAGIMVGYEKLILKERPNLCLVVGDVTSTMACAITARKLLVPVAHVEAGVRSGDETMPEEINRMVTDSISNYFFTTSKIANENLRKNGVQDERIFFVGNTMIDTLLKNRLKFVKPELWDCLNLEEKKYFILTLHRPANVDEEAKLKEMISEIVANSLNLPIIFPVHPRTAKIIANLDISFSNLHFVEPMGYLQFNYLVERSKAVITDSGGITEETTVMGIPCMTLRNNTERPETISIGTNELLGINPKNIKPAMEKLFKNEWKKGNIPELWDGKTGERIIQNLMILFKLSALQ
jgi:UDP-N-acetylglucosamine 2-epimerase (non-hydrolysing)